MKAKYILNPHVRQLKKDFTKELKSLYLLKSPAERQNGVIEFCGKIKEAKHEIDLLLKDLEEMNFKVAEEILGVNIRKTP